MMMRQVTLINWRYIGDAVPAFVTLLFMPFSYSVAYGLIAGILCYVTLNTMIYLTRIISMGYFVPEDEDHKEYWTWKPAGAAPWFIRVCQDPHKVFRHSIGKEDDEVQEITSTQSSFDERAHYATEPQKGEKDTETISAREVRVAIPRGSLDKGLDQSPRSYRPERT
jgi:AGZA family xanthine/uracil permease-like MFS transporter